MAFLYIDKKSQLIPHILLMFLDFAFQLLGKTRFSFFNKERNGQPGYCVMKALTHDRSNLPCSVKLFHAALFNPSNRCAVPRPCLKSVPRIALAIE